ncbi:zinc finger protein 665-like [Mercenaria mercenaria]|uniref:zinc finger protein 665-like n=1 Tax=Mercenaria mercenaria TaxID=6596 RepID=UPI00234F3E40|nr:zinc finger protein 665-like [Mercenaria mercenaria]
MAHTCSIVKQLHSPIYQDSCSLFSTKDVFRCGGCNLQFDTICTLHDHVQTHSGGGSYYYSHTIKAAFPKYDSSCRSTQTDDIAEFQHSEMDQLIGIKKDVDYEKEHLSNGEGGSNLMPLSKKKAAKGKHKGSCHQTDPKRIDEKCTETNQVACVSKTKSKETPNITHEKDKTLKMFTTDTYFTDADNDDTDADDYIETNDGLFERVEENMKEKSVESTHLKDDDDDYDYDVESNNDLVDEVEENVLEKSVENDVNYQSADIQTGSLQNDTSGSVGVKVEQDVIIDLKSTNIKPKYKCELCGAKFKCKLSLHIHSVEHHQQGDSALKCQQCDLVFAFRNRLVNHMQIRHKVAVTKDSRQKGIQKRARKLKRRNKSWPCDSCDKVYSTESGLYFHKQGKHSGEKFECKLCNAEYSFKHTLRSHLIEVHNLGKEGHQCKECGKVFAYLSRLVHHQKVKHPTEDDFKECFVCEFCGKEFLVKSRLREHLRDSCINHERKYQCPHCPYLSFTKTCLREHINNMHSTESKHMCHICGQVFRNGHSLYIHRVVHSEERNFLCKTCDKTFKTDNQLKRHVKIHENRKVFKCHVCDKGFVQSNNLKAHMRQHTGEKPFKCDWCEQKFTHNVSRKNHMSKCEAKLC